MPNLICNTNYHKTSNYHFNSHVYGKKRILLILKFDML